MDVRIDGAVSFSGFYTCSVDVLVERRAIEVEIPRGGPTCLCTKRMHGSKLQDLRPSKGRGTASRVKVPVDPAALFFN